MQLRLLCDIHLRGGLSPLITSFGTLQHLFLISKGKKHTIFKIKYKNIKVKLAPSVVPLPTIYPEPITKYITHTHTHTHTSSVLASTVSTRMCVFAKDRPCLTQRKDLGNVGKHWKTFFPSQ